MNTMERIQAAISLKPVSQTPVAPMIISFAGRCAGMTQAELFGSFGQWQRAMEITFERVGQCDAVFPMWPRDAALSQPLRALLPGRDLDHEAQFQLVEAEVMTRQDYADIVKQGYSAWFASYQTRIRPDLSDTRLGRIKTTFSYIRQGMRMRRNVAHWQRRGIPAMFYSACYPAFDLFSLARSLTPFCHDLRDCPKDIERACEVATPAIIATAKIPLRITRGKRVCIFPMRSSASFISPRLFERLALPHLKCMVQAFAEDGIVSVLHCDGNWTPLLAYLRELPRASCIVELDGGTDIFKAKEILGDWLCLKGDVPATLLAHGKPGQVVEYCERLIQYVGCGGGFILSSGCEVPLDAKPENVAALIQVARQTSFLCERKNGLDL